jgi:hypothetical protein
MGASRPIIGREAWGRGHPAQPEGGILKKLFPGPPEGPFANKKLFLFANGSLREHPARPEGGRHPARPVGGMFKAIFFCYFPLEFMIYNLFEIQTVFKCNIDSPYSFVYI